MMRASIVAYNVRDETGLIGLLNWHKELMTVNSADNDSKLEIPGG